MATKVRQVKASISGDHERLKDVVAHVREGHRKRASRTVRSVQKSLTAQQLKLNFVLRRLAFHKGQTAEEKSKRTEAERKLRTLRARLRRGQ